MNLDKKLERKKVALDRVEFLSESFLIGLNIRKSKLEINPEVHTKTKGEKELISKMKSECKEYQLSGSIYTEKEQYQNPLKLIVNMSNPSKVKDLKTTHSFMCFKSEIADIISDLRNNKYEIKNVYYNNHIYKF